jgi:beta-lactamase class A
MDEAALRARILKISAEAGHEAMAVSVFDYETCARFAHEDRRWFHAASTIKAAILLGLYKLADEGRLRLGDTLHVRNRFRSIVDGGIFRVAVSRDGDPDVHQRLGRSMRVRDLARAMIVRSSNLATNLLLDYAGLDEVRRVLREAKIEGVKLKRGVEDTTAFERGLNNEVTAAGLVALFRILCEGPFLRERTRAQMLEILGAQEFNSMIPAGLPREARVAHKTGEISTICHDAGIVFLPARKPCVIAILTELPASSEQRHKPVAEISRAIFEELAGVEK